VKKAKVSTYSKATERMDREISRAVAQVERLSKLYAKTTLKK
jgi:N-dimethylarginine dimethylaminohydrolase